MTSISSVAKQNGAEIAAVILCCRVFLQTATAQELIAFVADNKIDWDKFVYLAQINRVRPVVYKALSGINIPEQLQKNIRREQTQIIALNWKQALETERIILLLADNGIKAVPYKGAAYSKQFFGDLAYRESSDIDLVIHPDDLYKAVDLLKQDNYQPELDHVYQYLGAKYPRYYKDYNLNKFAGKTREFHVEFHWAIAENYIGVHPRVNQVLFDSPHQNTLVKSPVFMMTDAAHFSAMMVHHSIKDTFRNIKNVLDIAQAIKHPGIKNEYEKLKEKLSGLGLKKALGVSNNLSQALFGVSLPLKQGAGAYNKETNYFFDQICSDDVLPAESEPNIAMWMRKRAMLQDSPLRKAGFYWATFKYRFTPTEPDFDIVQFPKSLFFVYYLMKPIRSLLKPYDYTEKKKELARAQ